MYLEVDSGKVPVQGELVGALIVAEGALVGSHLVLVVPRLRRQSRVSIICSQTETESYRLEIFIQ